MQLIFYGILMGVGATLFMDAYAVILRRFFNIPSLDYRLLGRWIGSFRKGIFFHKSILQTESVTNEKLIGWMAHYGIGITFAILLLLLLLFIYGINWLEDPTLFPAIFIGLSTTVAPFFMMQPAFGFGIAASKTPNPRIARIRSLCTHLVYGIGLYFSALLISVLIK